MTIFLHHRTTQAHFNPLDFDQAQRSSLARSSFLCREPRSFNELYLSRLGTMGDFVSANNVPERNSSHLTRFPNSPSQTEHNT